MHTVIVIPMPNLYIVMFIFVNVIWSFIYGVLLIAELNSVLGLILC